MESTEEYPGMDPNRTPVWHYEEGHVYCDGIEVMPWQMTDEEREKHIPKEDLQKFIDPGSAMCPLECGMNVIIASKVSWINHTRFKHPDFYKIHGDDMTALKLWLMANEVALLIFLRRAK